MITMLKDHEALIEVFLKEFVPLKFWCKTNTQKERLK